MSKTYSVVQQLRIFFSFCVCFIRGSLGYAKDCATNAGMLPRKISFVTGVPRYGKQFLCVLWTIWRERNNRIFDVECPNHVLKQSISYLCMIG